MSKLIRAISVLLLLSVLAGQVFVQSARPGKILLVETGEGFHGDEAPVKDGERWLGLYVTGGGSSLITSKVKVERVVDPVVDEDQKQMTGKSVSVYNPVKPVFLVKGAAMSTAMASWICTWL